MAHTRQRCAKVTRVQSIGGWMQGAHGSRLCDTLWSKAVAQHPCRPPPVTNPVVVERGRVCGVLLVSAASGDTCGWQISWPGLAWCKVALLLAQPKPQPQDQPSSPAATPSYFQLNQAMRGAEQLARYRHRSGSTTTAATQQQQQQQQYSSSSTAAAVQQQQYSSSSKPT